MAGDDLIANVGEAVLLEEQSNEEHLTGLAEELGDEHPSAAYHAGMLSADRSGVPRVQTDILRLPVPDAAVDGVTCGFALRNLLDGWFFTLEEDVLAEGVVDIAAEGVDAEVRADRAGDHQGEVAADVALGEGNGQIGDGNLFGR